MRLFFIGLLILLSTGIVQARSIDDLRRGIDRAAAEYGEGGEEHTTDFTQKFYGNALLKKVESELVKNPNAPEDLREKIKAAEEKIVDLDKRCAAVEGQARAACDQQVDRAIDGLEKMVADAVPRLKLALNQAESAMGSFLDDVDPEKMVEEADKAIKDNLALIDFEAMTESLPISDTKQAIAETKVPALSSPEIKQTIASLGSNLDHKRLATADKQPVSDDPDQGFWDKTKNWFRQFAPGVEQAFILQVWAAAPVGSLGQTGQSQLKVISSNRELAAFEKESFDVNTERDRRVTEHNDVTGQGKAAFNERFKDNLSVMNDITKEQAKTLQSIEHVCQSHRASVPCWESGNDIPFDRLAQLYGATGEGGGGGGAQAKVPELDPFQVWLHCPEAAEGFFRDAAGTRLSGLFLAEKDRQILTVKSALPTNLHQDGCIVALASEDGPQFYTAQPQEPIADAEGPGVEADLVLLKIATVHTEKGQDLGDPDLSFEDFINDYWPESAVCTQELGFKLGDKIKVLGFEPSEEGQQPSAEVQSINGLTTLISESNGKTRFTTNGDPSFSGGSVAAPKSGCWKGLASIKTNGSDTVQILIPLRTIEAWLKQQNIKLPNLGGATDGGR